MSERLLWSSAFALPLALAAASPGRTAEAPVLADDFDGARLDPALWITVPGRGVPEVRDGYLRFTGASRSEVQSRSSFPAGIVLLLRIESPSLKPHSEATDTSFGLELFGGTNGRCHHGVLLVGNGHLGLLRSLPDEAGGCAGDPALQEYRRVPSWDALRARPALWIALAWTPSAVAVRVSDGGALSGEVVSRGEAIPDAPLRVRLNVEAGESCALDIVEVRPCDGVPGCLEIPEEPPFVRGDANGDGAVDTSDGVRVLGYLFLGGSLSCEDAADADDGGTLDLSDAVYIFDYLFRGGPAIRAPYPTPGRDPTADGLGCGG